MNWKKLVLFGLLFWLIIFALVSVIMFIPGLPQVWQKITTLVVDAILGFLLAKWYFKSLEVSGIIKGFLFGIVVIIVATILDLAITVPVFIEGGYVAFYGAWSLWVGMAIFILFAGFGGMCSGGCRKEKNRTGLINEP